MTTAATQPSRPLGYWLQLRERVGRLLRNNVLRAVIGAHLVAAATILLRYDGWLQPSELVAYDALRVAWAGPLTSDRVVLVGATESDITSSDAKEGRRWGWPVRDGKLAELLERLASWKPRAIAVDLYRDIPEPPGTEQLDAVLQRHPEIIWTFKLRDDAQPGIPPPKILRDTDRAVLADTIVDRDSILRRGLLFADDGTNQYTEHGIGAGIGISGAQAHRVGPRSGGRSAAWQGGDPPARSIARPLHHAR